MTTSGPLLDDLFSRADLDAALADRHVSVQYHPTLPLRILNYTAAAQYERVWNDVTLTCRGLVIDDEDRIVARPVPKFFNLGEDAAPAVPSGTFVCADKLDGSLGILFSYKGHVVAATRGSFTSPQSQIAMSLLATDHPDWAPPAGVTVCAEIIAPTNRIVVDYGPRRELVALTAIDNFTGADVALSTAGWTGAMADVYDHADIAALTELAEGGDGSAEGFVLIWHHPDRPATRLKVKFAEYKRLHRVITNVNAVDIYVAWGSYRMADFPSLKRVAWALNADPAEVELAMKSNVIETLADRTPDEFHDWLRDLCDGFDRDVADIISTHQRFVDGLVANEVARRDMDPVMRAAGINSGIAFGLLDGRDVRPFAWRAVRPEGGVTPWANRGGVDIAALPA